MQTNLYFSNMNEKHLKCIWRKAMSILFISTNWENYQGAKSGRYCGWSNTIAASRGLDKQAYIYAASIVYHES